MAKLAERVKIFLFPMEIMLEMCKSILAMVLINTKNVCSLRPAMKVG